MAITNSFAMLQTESQWCIFLQKAMMRSLRLWNARLLFYKARALASPLRFNTCTSFLKRQSSWKRKDTTFTCRDEVLGPTKPDKSWDATTSDLEGFNLKSIRF